VTTDRKGIRREMAWLVIGVVLGGIFGIVGNLWASYYVKWLEQTYPNEDWTTTIIWSSIALVAVTAILVFWAFRQFKRTTS